MSYLKPTIQALSASVEEASCCTPGYSRVGPFLVGGDCNTVIGCIIVCV